MEPLLQEKIIVPPVYFWLDVEGEKAVLMTAAVRWKGQNFGLSFPVEENKVLNQMASKKLLTHMREVVSVLVLHGDKVLDSLQQIDPLKVNDQEAIHWKMDPQWTRKILAVNQLIKIKDITKQQALELKLL